MDITLVICFHIGFLYNLIDTLNANIQIKTIYRGYLYFLFNHGVMVIWLVFTLPNVKGLERIKFKQLLKQFLIFVMYYAVSYNV
ncbi:hypothetical protein D0T84_22355 [Dysgonomonas sp. 521]|nr:hypothetical protein [Dysgonomonas sp. 521]